MEDYRSENGRYDTWNIPWRAEIYLSDEDRKELLLRRGFTPEDIENQLRDYRSGEKSWMIKRVTPAEVAESGWWRVLRELFAKDSVDYRWGSTGGFWNFQYFYENPIGFSVSPAELDPYIACFVREVNECGAFTSMSCDGWHKKYNYNSPERRADEYRAIKLWMADRYSMIWLWLIMEDVFDEKWSEHVLNSHEFLYPTSEHNYKWTPCRYESLSDYRMMRAAGCLSSSWILVYQMPSTKTVVDNYRKMYERALFLKDHRAELLEVRQRMIDGIREEFGIPAGQTSEQLERSDPIYVRKLMQKHIGDGLKRIGEEFISDCEEIGYAPVSE